MVLEDRGFLEKLRREVSRGHGAATAVKVAVAEYLEAFGRMEDPYLRERAADIRDIGRRIIAHLAGRGTPDPALSAEGILVAAEMLPSDMAALDPARVRGIVTERGEATSHAAIMARSLGIPALMGVKGALRGINQGDRLILDANSGCVYINPGEVVAAEYRRLEEEQPPRERPARRDARPPGAQPGRRAGDAAREHRPGQRPGGRAAQRRRRRRLYRTEFPYMVREDFPAARTSTALPPRRRGLPRGAGHDPHAGRRRRQAPAVRAPAHEENPFMGLRSVRFTLENPEIFRTQIEAILMAGVYGPVRILFPLITSLEEVRRCKAVVAEAREALTREGVAFEHEVPLGIMIEVPAAVWQAPELAGEVDFFSVGTNDLVQYLLAADRNNPLVRRYYDHLHPAVLAALRHVAEAARREKCGLSICGEMATEPRAFLLLFGLGYREFSLPAPFIPRMKQLLAGISPADAAETAAECLRQGDASRVATLLDARSRPLQRRPLNGAQPRRQSGRHCTILCRHASQPRGGHSMAQVKKGDRVKFNYALTLKDGKVFETNMGQAPLEITVGKGKAIKGLENALVGMSPGQTKTVVVKPADGYGAKDPAFVWTVPAGELPAGRRRRRDRGRLCARRRLAGRGTDREGRRRPGDGRRQPPARGARPDLRDQAGRHRLAVKIGILSDSHDDLAAIAKAVELFNAEGVVQVLHAGDIVSPFTFELFRGFRRRSGGSSATTTGTGCSCASARPVCCSPAAHRDARRAARGFVHEPPLVKALARSGDFDIVVYGHTHVPEVQREGATLVVNPARRRASTRGVRRWRSGDRDPRGEDRRAVDGEVLRTVSTSDARVERLVEVGDAPGLERLLLVDLAREGRERDDRRSR